MILFLSSIHLCGMQLTWVILCIHCFSDKALPIAFKPWVCVMNVLCINAQFNGLCFLLYCLKVEVTWYVLFSCCPRLLCTSPPSPPPSPPWSLGQPHFHVPLLRGHKNAAGPETNTSLKCRIWTWLVYHGTGWEGDSQQIAGENFMIVRKAVSNCLFVPVLLFAQFLCFTDM